MWGTDLSGSMQGAGGVGGLLAENLVGTGVQFAAYDGNGNVVALVSATNGATTANYAYGPFGELLAAYGVAAKLNDVLFSSKIYDWETGLYYYGHRYYNPSTGRWPSRDPLGERGFEASLGIPPRLRRFLPPGEILQGADLYQFVGNDPENKMDFVGLAFGGVWHPNNPCGKVQPCSKSACQKYAWKGYEAAGVACLLTGPLAAGCEVTVYLAYVAADNLCEACTAP
jgi:RHS repeat-associated protein